MQIYAVKHDTIDFVTKHKSSEHLQLIYNISQASDMFVILVCVCQEKI